MRLAARLLAGVAVLALLTYVGDYAVWRVRVARGGGMGEITVSVLVAAPLKGNREEYYPEGSSNVACSQSLFQQAGAGACWWMARHRTVIER